MTEERKQTSIIIVGGGTAGWMAAAALAERFGSSGRFQITLIESDAIGTIGVGEATVPAMREYLKRLKIDEVDFVRRTDASFKLAVGFEGWRGGDEMFLHPFAEHGVSMAGVGFSHLYNRLSHLGAAGPLDDYNMGSALALTGKFALPKPNPNTGSHLFNFAFHFDAGLVAKYLSSWARTAGVKRVEGRIVSVRQDGENGHVQAVKLEDSREVAGDFFVDCSGFRGLLIEEALGTGYENWSHWLPVDRAIAQASDAMPAPTPYTLSSARQAGWQWRVPLQTRTGNGHVYCSAYMDDEAALGVLQGTLGTPSRGEPRHLKFTTGVRKKIWNKNVFCLGLASGFLEPLESTSIYLMQSGLFALVNNFPNGKISPALQDEVNRRNRGHWEHIRDFIILHYYLNERRGEPFWDSMRHLDIPASLAETIALYRETGQIRKEQTEFFQKSSWISIFAGFGIVPRYYHPSADDIERDLLEREFANLRAGFSNGAGQALDHEAFLRTNCPTLAQMQESSAA